MYWEIVKTPTKCSHYLWVTKVNKNPEITSAPAMNCEYVIKFQLESLLSTYHISQLFPFNVSCKQNINLTKVFM